MMGKYKIRKNWLRKLVRIKKLVTKYFEIDISKFSLISNFSNNTFCMNAEMFNNKLMSTINSLNIVLENN